MHDYFREFKFTQRSKNMAGADSLLQYNASSLLKKCIILTMLMIRFGFCDMRNN